MITLEIGLGVFAVFYFLGGVSTALLELESGSWANRKAIILLCLAAWPLRIFGELAMLVWVRLRRNRNGS